MSFSKGPLLQPKDCVLIVIDIQKKLMPVIYNQQLIIANILSLLKFAKIIGLPIIVSEQIKLGPTLLSVASELEGVNPIEKITFNCFGSKLFRDKLMKLGRSSLLLTGVETHICVAHTALTAARHYHVQVVSDAVSSRTEINRNVAFDRFRLNGITITSTEMLMFELLREAGSSEFKAALPLIK